MVRQYKLVTGAAGFIAYHLIDRLLKDGTPVVGVDNFDPFYSPDLKRRNIADLVQTARERGTDFVFLDCPIEALKPEAFSKTPLSGLIHLAARAGVLPSSKTPQQYVETNVWAMTGLLELCRTMGVDEVLFASSSSVYGQSCPAPFLESGHADSPLSVYGATKRSGEILLSTYARLFKMKGTALRFFTVYGPRQRPDLAIHKFFHAVVEGHPITLFADPNGGRDYTYVSDTVDGIVGAIRFTHQMPKGTYECFNLGSGRVISPAELIEKIEKVSTRKAILKHDAKMPGDMPLTFAEISKSKSQLGFEPKVSFEDGLRSFYRWYQSEHLLQGKKKAA